MSDSYQPIFDAVRSRIGHPDFDSIFRDVVTNAFDLSSVRGAMVDTAYEGCRPFVLLRPAISIDGNQWCALYGDNLQDGVAGFGDSPDDAARAFDVAWFAKLKVMEAPQ